MRSIEHGVNILKALLIFLIITSTLCLFIIIFIPPLKQTDSINIAESDKETEAIFQGETKEILIIES